MDAEEPYWLYGLHTLRAALMNPRRTVHRVLATSNALRRLDLPPEAPGVRAAEKVDVRQLNRLLGDAVHQGVAALVDPLASVDLDALAERDLVLCLDHVTDPHNVGAILRSAAAFGAGGVVLTRRNSASETGVLAKSASGALDLVDVALVTNLSRALDRLRAAGHTAVALDSEAAEPIGAIRTAERLTLVLGAEGKGVRPGVRASCDLTAAIEAEGALASLNVSNAAAIALYVARRTLTPVPA